MELSPAWYRLAFSAEVAYGAFGVEACGERLVLFRDEQRRIAVLNAVCPHLGADLSWAPVIRGAVECPFHKWRFERDGQISLYGPGPMVSRDHFRARSFPARDVGGLVFAWFGSEPPTDASPVGDLPIEARPAGAADLGERTAPLPGGPPERAAVSLRWMGRLGPWARGQAAVSRIPNAEVLRVDVTLPGLGEVLIFHTRTPIQPGRWAASERWFVTGRVPLLLASWAVQSWRKEWAAGLYGGWVA